MLALPVAADKGQWYLGGNIGQSILDPDPGATIYTADQDTDSGFKVYAGYDITENWSVEGFYADLGTATFKPEGSLDYDMKGIGINYYYPASRPGFAGFVKGGIGQLDNTGHDVNYRRAKDTQIFLGAGLEYQFNNRLSLRGEYEYYDEDAQFLSVGFAWRFGGSQLWQPPAPKQKVSAPSVSTMGLIEHKQEIANDHAVQPTPVQQVAPNFTGVLEGVTFKSGSAQLTSEAMSILSGVAEQLKLYPDINIKLIGHTDSRGNADNNKQLSYARAKRVTDFFVEQGIESSRMRYIGRGELEPRASNETSEGRALNRRVELLAQ